MEKCLAVFLCGLVILLMAESSAAINCYNCVGWTSPCNNVSSSTPTQTCPAGTFQCQTIFALGVYYRSCANVTASSCYGIGGAQYCTYVCNSTDYCNTFSTASSTFTSINALLTALIAALAFLVSHNCQ